MVQEKEPKNLEDVVEGIEELGEENSEVTLGDALDAFGHRSFAPLLIILPLVELSPLGGVPGFPTALAIIIALIAAQLLVGRDHVWLPDFVENRSVDGEKLATAMQKLNKTAEWIDHRIGDRLDWMLTGPSIKLAALLVLLLCLSVPPLEFVPFASSIPMLAVACIGLALLVRDGLLLLVAMVAGGGSVMYAISTMVSGTGGG